MVVAVSVGVTKVIKSLEATGSLPSTRLLAYAPALPAPVNTMGFTVVVRHGFKMERVKVSLSLAPSKIDGARTDHALF